MNDSTPDDELKVLLIWEPIHDPDTGAVIGVSFGLDWDRLYERFPRLLSKPPHEIQAKFDAAFEGIEHEIAAELSAVAIDERMRKLLADGHNIMEDACPACGATATLSIDHLDHSIDHEPECPNEAPSQFFNEYLTGLFLRRAAADHLNRRFNNGNQGAHLLNLGLNRHAAPSLDDIMTAYEIALRVADVRDDAIRQLQSDSPD